MMTRVHAVYCTCSSVEQLHMRQSVDHSVLNLKLVCSSLALSGNCNNKDAFDRSNLAALDPDQAGLAARPAGSQSYGRHGSSRFGVPHV